HRYFDRPYLYGPPPEAYPDNLERFAFLSRGALELVKALGWIPDVIHAHDWQTALAPVYADTVEWAQPLHGSTSVYTVHNLPYHGVFDGGAFPVTGLGPEHYHPREFEHFGTVNLTKAALYRSTMLTTVSPTYAREIQTGAYGCGLDGILAERRDDLVGVLNGIDVEEWDPTTDPHLAAPFDAEDLRGKARGKAALQQEAALPVRSDVPLLALIARLVPQKGVDVFAQALETILTWGLQVIMLGSGEADAERFFTARARAASDRFCAWFPFDDARAHRVQAGADFFVMPSRFEPCGLSPLYAMRYRTLPIGGAAGGPVDTGTPYDEATAAGTGFVFHDLRADSLADTIGWAVSTWYHRPAHLDLMRRRVMAQDHSWDRAARTYTALYLAAYARRRGHAFPLPADVAAEEAPAGTRLPPRRASRAPRTRTPDSETGLRSRSSDGH